MTFILSGFVSLDDRYSGFLIPIFSNSSSNHPFVQDLRAGFLINKFMIFNTEEYNILEFVPPPIEKRINDTGILALSLNKDVLFGSFNDLKEKLLTTDLSSMIDPFSLVDVYSFIGDKENLRHAILAAKSKFSSEIFAELWSEIELNSGNGAEFRYTDEGNNKDEVDKLQSSINILINDPHSAEWHNIWRKLWAAHPGEMRLSLLAKWWINGYPNKFGIPDVLMTILADKHVSKNYDNSVFVDLAERWLIENETEAAIWPNLWLQAVKKIQYPSNHMLNAAMFYLLRDNEDSIIAGRNWSRVWKKLVDFDGLNADLRALAHQRSDALKDNREFIRSVAIRLLLIKEDSDWCLKILTLWMNKYEKPDNLWVNAFLNASQLEHFPAWEFGSRWLRLHQNPRSWSIVWRVLYERGEHRSELFSIAREWLKRTDTPISVWLQIMTDLVRSEYYEEQDIDLAMRRISRKINFNSPINRRIIIEALEKESLFYR